MIKKLILGTGVAVVLALVLVGRDALSYLRTSVGCVKDSVHNSVPIEFQIERARRMIKDLEPEVRKNMHLIAKEEVAVEQLHKQVSDLQGRLAKEEEELKKLHGDVKSGKTAFEYGGRKYTAEQVRTDLAPAPDKRGPTVLASGGVKRRKGTHLLVAALAHVREGVPDVQLVVTGRQDDPAYLADVRAQIAALGLDDHVLLAGQIPDDALLGWYQNADVFALPSLSVGERFEGFGLVFLEASASGLPVIGTTGSGVEEAIITGETGLLVPQDDPDALAGAIARLLQDEPLRARMGAAGRAYARTQDWSAVAGRVKDVYAALA